MNINEQIELAVAEVLLEVRTGFDMREFRQLDSEAQYKYAKEKLKTLSSQGTSRVVFLLSNRHVLKLAWPPSYDYDPDAHQKGMGQNKAEVDAATNPDMMPVITKVFDFDSKKYNWIIAELVRPLSRNEFYQKIGVKNSGALYKAIDILVNDTNFDFDEAIIIAHQEVERFKWELENADSAMNKHFTRQLEYFSDVEQALHTPFLELIVKLDREFDIRIGDLATYDHWGKTADGRMVLLDYGFTREVQQKHYM